MADARVRIVDYDPAWPGRFAEQRMVVEGLLRPWLAGPVEHIGSTAVPGLRAKPVIDLLAPVSSLAGARAAVPVLADAGWLFWPQDP
ncbi:MAG: GrpB family protein, partial [Actinobacteria bacterium]|nr:GrpB family protein [Actinomycetota bacterium]